jgi:hypothetical protein
LKSRLALALLFAGLPAAVARADTKAVIFDATVAAACTLAVNSNGTMVASADLGTLSSKLAGGSPASLTLSTTGGVDLSVDPVTAVTVPAADVTATTWTPTYSVAGAHTVAESGATTALAAPGTSTVSVNLVGTKGGSDRFAAGSYQAMVTVRCE